MLFLEKFEHKMVGGKERGGNFLILCSRFGICSRRHCNYAYDRTQLLLNLNHQHIRLISEKKVNIDIRLAKLILNAH